MRNKKGQLAGNTIFGIMTFVIGIIVAFVVISAITGAGLLTSGTAEDTAVDNVVGNLTDGVSTNATKIATIITIAFVVILLGYLLFLVQRARSMNMGGGSSL